MNTIQRRTFLNTVSAASLVSLAGCTGFLSDDSIALEDPIETAQDSPDWPQVRHDTLNTGHNPSATGPLTSPEEAWAIEYGDGGPWTNPVVIDETVFIGGDRVNALDLRSGEERWSREIEGHTFQGVAASGDVLYIGSRTTRETDGERIIIPYMNCFDVMTGELRWSEPLDEGYRFNQVRPPTVIGGLVVSASTNHYAIFRAADGERIWHSARLSSLAPPACTSSHLVIRYHSGGAVFEWDGPLDEPIARLPAQDHYIPPVMQDEYVLLAESVMIAPEDNLGTIRLYNVEGTTLGNLGSLSNIVSAPIVDGDKTGYLAAAAWHTDDGDGDVREAFVRSFDLTDGSTNWETRYPDSEYASAGPTPTVTYDFPTLSGTSLFVSFTHNGIQPVVHCLDPRDGDERWSHQVSGSVGELVVIDDVLLVPTYDGRLVALH